MFERTNYPLYQCRKHVRAIKIARINGMVITPADEHEHFTVTNHYIRTYKPQAEEYFTVDEDGRTGYSSAKSFERWHTLVVTEL